MKAPSDSPHSQSPQRYPLQGEAGFSGARIPDFERLIPGCRDNEGPIRTHRTAIHPSGMPLQGEAGLSGASIPDFERLIVRMPRQSEGVPSRTDCTAIHPTAVCPCRVRRTCPVRSIPDFERVIRRMLPDNEGSHPGLTAQPSTPNWYARAG